MYLQKRPLRRADYWIVAVSSIEQIIGGALSTVISVMLPMLQMTLHPELPSFVQGIVGAMGLIGIGLGSVVIGKISDSQGYLRSFRLCPVIIIIGSLICYFLPNVPCLVIGLLTIGIGVGGGYSLDSAYISELLPRKWRLFMVGTAKATCSIGFIGAAVAGYLILKHDPNPHIWSRMALIITAMGIVTLLLRIHWAESPQWLLAQGRKAEALKAAQFFLGPDIELPPADDEDNKQQPQSPAPKFSVKANLNKVIFSGIPWACEGLGVYGFSVFLPILVMALGFEQASATGIHKILGSVDVSIVVNFFILPGFVIGLLLVRKINNVKMMYVGFLLSAIGLLLLWVSYISKWPSWVMLLGFIIFEVSLNAGPHLITFIIPAHIYPVAERAEGNGVAALMGKVGAVSGVILMPLLLHWGGVTLVLTVSAAVMLTGALVGIVYGKLLGLLSPHSAKA